MKLINVLLLTVALCGTAYAHTNEELPELNKRQVQQLEDYLAGIYVINALEGPFPPYICMWSVFWEEYWYPVEGYVRHLIAHMPRNEQNKPLTHLVMWRGVLNGLGCGDYDVIGEHE
jgi:hypothetical protein